MPSAVTESAAFVTIQRIWRGLAVLALTATMGAAGVMAAGRWVTPSPLGGPVGDGSGVGRQRAWFSTSGFYPPEFDAASNRQFSWTGAHAEFVVPRLDRQSPYRFAVVVSAGRGPGAPPPPTLLISVDGVILQSVDTSNDPTSYEVDIPPSSRPGATVALDVSSTFVPGPTDRRALGVVVERVQIARRGATGFVPAPGALAAGALAAAACALVCLLAGLPVAAVLAAGIGSAGAFAWLLALDGAFLGSYPDRLVGIAVGVTALAVLVGAFRHWGPRLAAAPEWTTAVAVTIVLGAVRLAFFAHPQARIGDAIFQVHRASAVRAGNYFFTSITPRPYFEFPYAIALYVTSLPFWRWFPTELDQVRLLRGLALGADALVGLALYFVLRRATGRRWPALAAAALWPFCRITSQALCTANLTNVYGQGLFGVALLLVAGMAAAGTASLTGAVVVAVLLAVAFLSHFSTLSVGVPLAGAVGLALLLRTGPRRRLGAMMLAATVAATATSYVVYYSHFHQVYRTTIARVLSREGAGEARSMVAPVSTKAERWQYDLGQNFGLPLLLSAAAGVWWLLLRRRTEGLTTVLLAWALVWVTFAALGIFTPIEMRANLAAAPLFVAASALGLGVLAGTSRAGRWFALAAALAIAADGASQWIVCLTG